MGPQQETDKDRIFNTAAEILHPVQRAAYLDQACADDAGLRAEIEDLLRHDADAGSFLDKPAVGLAPTVTPGESDTTEDAPGAISLAFLVPSDKPNCIGMLAHYEVLEVVGRGGMGLVLRALDPKLNRVVAIKVMAPELAANPMAVKRFLREAQASAAVSHDHVVTIHAIHEENRPPFIVMEYVDGLSLQEKIDREGALELKEILRIAMQTAAGLAAAHQQGLVHRDIKPANILLENGVERVKITDFGLARAVDDVSVTRTGLIAGTPQFMSPEQAQGHPIDARSDLFSLGSVLYMMCTGRPPFRADTAVAMLRRVTDDTPRPVREVNSDVPHWLEAIIFKLLAKHPEERFQSAAELAELLGQYLAHLQQPSVVPLPSGFLSHRGGVAWARRWAVAAAALLVLVGGLGFTEATGVTELVPTIVRIVTGEGMLIIEVDDPNVSVEIDDEELVIQGAGVHEVRVRPGRHEVQALKDGRPVHQELVTITRGGKRVVKVTLASSAGALAEAPRTMSITEVRRLEGHNDDINAVAFSSDGRFLFSGGGEKLLYQWDLAAGTVVRKIPVGGPPHGLAVLPDGHHVITSQFTGSITLWNLADGRPVRQFSGHAGAVNSICVSPDGKRLLSGGHDGLVRLWDIETGSGVHSFSEGYCNAVAMSDDGRIAAHGTRGGGIRIWETQSARTLQEIQRATRAIDVAAFSPGGEFLVSGDGDGVIQVWDVKTAKEVYHFDAHRDNVRRIGNAVIVSSLVFTPDGRHFISGGYDQTLRVFELSRGLEVAHVKSNTLCVSNLAISPDGRTLVSAGGMQPIQIDGVWQHRKDGDYAIRLWRLPESVWAIEPLAEVRQFEGHTDFIEGVAFSADGSRILAGSNDGMVRMWNGSTGKELFSLNAGDAIRSVAISSDDHRAAAGLESGGIVVWDLDSQCELHRLAGHEKPPGRKVARVMSMMFSPDGKQLLSGGDDGAVRMWNLESGEQSRQLEGTGSPIQSVAWSFDGSTILAAEYAGVVSLWDAKSRRLLQRSGKPKSHHAAFSPDGGRIVAGLTILDTPSLLVLTRLHADRTLAFTAIRFTADGRFVVGGVKDGSLRVWDASTGREVARATNQHHATAKIAVSSNGRYLASGGGVHWDGESEMLVRHGDYAIHLWRLPESVWPKQPKRDELTGATARPWDVPSRKASNTSTNTTMAQPKPLATLVNHNSQVRSLAFAPGAATLATGAGDGAIRLWDTGTWQLLARWHAHDDWVNGLAFSPDGLLASAGLDSTVKLWNLPQIRELAEKPESPQQAQPLATFAHNGRVTAVAFSGDGKTLASTSDVANEIRLWDVETQTLRETIPEGANSLAFCAPEGGVLISGSPVHGVRVWNARTGERIPDRISQDTAIFAVAVSGEGTWLASAGGADHPIAVRRIMTGEWEHAFTGHRYRGVGPVAIFSVAFSPNRRWLASASGSQQSGFGELKLWDMWTSREFTFEEHTRLVWSVAFSPDGTSLAAASADGTVRIWDTARFDSVEPLFEVGRLRGHTKRPMELLFLADGTRALSSSGDGTIRLWDVETGDVIRHFVDEQMEVAHCMALSSDERLLVTGHGPNRNMVRIWDFDSGTVLRRIDAHEFSVFDVGFIPEGNQVVSIAYDNHVRFWDLETGNKVRELGPFEGANCLAVAPGGDVVVGRYSQHYVFEFPNFGIARELTGPDVGATDVAVTRDGRLAASASHHGKIHLWDLETAKQLARLDGHTDNVEVLTFTPDGRHLLSGSWDRTLRVWDVATHQEVARATTQHRTSLELAVSPDSRTVLAGGGEWWDNENKRWIAENDYDLRLWRLPESVLPKAAHNALGRAEHAAGWRLLFDGKTLDGWNVVASDERSGNWTLEDGWLIGNPKSYLVTEEEFDDFELSLDWKIGPGGNGGIFYRTPTDVASYAQHAAEFQVVDNAAHPDGKTPGSSCGAVHRILPPSRDASKPAGDVNASRIVCRGSHVEHWLNGEKILEYDAESDRWKDAVRSVQRGRKTNSPYRPGDDLGQSRRGRIAFQAWDGRVWYRNVKIRLLTETGPSLE